MLPSKGALRLLNCPFFESGLCDRPYCHFRHNKTSATNTMKEAPLAQTQDLETLVHSLVPQITELELIAIPNITHAQPLSGVPAYYPTPIADLEVYNPTPIPQLNRQHLPVACTSINGSSKVQLKRRPSDSSLASNFRHKCNRTGESPQQTSTLSTALPKFSWRLEYDDVYVPRSKVTTSVQQITSETSNAIPDLQENKIQHYINSNKFTINATGTPEFKINATEQDQSVHFYEHDLTDVNNDEPIMTANNMLDTVVASTSSKEDDRSTNTEAIRIHYNQTRSHSSESLLEDKESKHKKHTGTSKHEHRHSKSHRDHSGSKTTHSKKCRSSRSETSSHRSSSSKQKHTSGRKSSRCEPNRNANDRVRTTSTIGAGVDTDSKDSLDLDIETLEVESNRILNELKAPPEAEALVSQAISPRTVEVPKKKLRVAHKAAHVNQVIHSLKRPVVNTALMVAHRYGMAKKSLEQNKQESALNEDRFNTRSRHSSTRNPQLQKMDGPAATSSNVQREIPAATNSKPVRVAHVPNVGKLLEEKARIKKYIEMHKELNDHRQRKAEAMKHHDEHVRAATLAQTAPKGTKRVAHIPTLALLEKPIISSEVGKKIPTTTRQAKLNMLIEEHMIFYSKHVSHKLAEEQEKSVYTRSNNLSTYNSLVTSAILNVRKLIASKAPYEPKGVEEVGSHSLESSKIEPHREQPSVYLQLRKFILSEVQLVENGFPRQHPTRVGSAVAKLQYDKEGPVRPFERQCARCKKPYEVDKHGLQVSKQTCEYHEGRIYKGQYRCCNEGFESSACCVSPKHVCSNFQLTNFGFQQTLPPKEHPENGDYGVYAIDCEMCYTTSGFELIRVTVVDHTLRTVLDKFVRPESPIVDYNTKFSGVSEHHLVGVDTTIRQIQTSLMTFINEKTILVGHSLDSDLRALKLLHNTVVDTSVIFPHTVATKKRALKTLATTILCKAIQQGDNGHDSAEDAIAAMELMLHKINY